MSLPQKTKFEPAFAITQNGQHPSQMFRDYMAKLDALVSAMAAGNLPLLNVAALTNAANDAAAAAAGVPLNSVYRNGSVLMVRVV